MRHLHLILDFIAVMVLLVACNPDTSEIVQVTATRQPDFTKPATSQPTSRPSATPTSTSISTSTPPFQPTYTPSPFLKPSPTPTPTPSPTTTLIPFLLFDAPPGLIYTAEDGIWQVAENNSLVRISDKPGAILSPDGGRVLYTQNDDVFLADLSTGEKRNVTQTPDRIECCPKWWPGQDNMIVLGSWPLDYQPDDNSFGNNELGFLTRVRIDNNTFELLDEDNGFYNWLAPRPYSLEIIYGDKIYDDSVGSQPFVATTFSVTPASDVPLQERVYAPVWSPLGDLLAGFVYRHLEVYSNSNEGIVLFDFDNNMIRYLYDYQVYGTDTPPPLPVWSPNGSMIAFYAREHEDENRGLRVIEAGTGETLFSSTQNVQLECYDEIVWNPQSEKIACATEEHGEKGYWLIDLSSGEVAQFVLPDGVHLIDWR